MKREKIKGQKKEKTYKAIMVWYTENHNRDKYKLYNLETNRVIMSRYIK